MLKIEEVTSFVEQKLNEIADTKDPKYIFNLFADFGKIKTASKINGLVKVIKGEPGNIAVLDDVEYIYLCQLLVPSSMSNFNIINIKNIVDEFISKNNGCEIAIGDGAGIFTFSTALAGDYKQEAGVGDIVPVQFNINIKYTSDALIASKKHWFLDGFEIPFISEGVYVDKEGITQKISGKNYSKTLITGQTKLYKFVFPFDTKNQLCVQLQRDLLNGDLNKQYELKYYDGVSFTKDEPFVTTVSIYKNGDSNVQILKTSQFNITFTDVDDGNGQVKYFLGLCDTVFDASSENTRYFENSGRITAKMKQQTYWEEKVNEGCAYEQIKCPNLQSLTITQQVYNNTHNYELFDLVNKNYAVIKVEQVEKPTKYFYYFITNATIGADNQVIYDLKLDTIQTYFFDDNIEFSDCLIERAHLNRWVRCTDENGAIDFEHVKFDGGVDSKLFAREEIQNVSKRLINRQKLSMYDAIENKEIREWLNENIRGWIYIYIDSDKKYYLPTSTDMITEPDFDAKDPPEPKVGFNSVKILSNERTSFIDTELSALCAPVFKKGSSIQIVLNKNVGDSNASIAGPGDQDSYKLQINGDAINVFMKNNKGASYIYSMKISAVPPFKQFPSKISYEINGPVLSIEASLNDVSMGNVGLDFKFFDNSGIKIVEYGTMSTFKDGLFYIDYQDPNIECESKSEFNYIFKKSDIIGASKNPIFNPKLLSSDFASFNIGNESSTFEYDAQKLNAQNIKIAYSEPLSPDITRSYIRYVGDDDYIYKKDTSKNFTGCVSVNDNSLMLKTDKFQEMLANNKNYFMQNSIARVEGVASGIMSSGLNLASKNYGAAITGVVGAITGYFTSKVKEKLTVDNMQSAPSSIQNAKGNVFLNYMSSDIGIYVEEYDILPSEKEMVNDYMDKFGFSCNFIDNPKRFCNIRKYHNFLQLELDCISGIAMSNIAREDIKERFRNGIRFWNSDDIQYEMENYEHWLEGIQI